MAGNIPMVGFHDFMCVFLSGHKQKIKCSSKDDILIPHLIHKLIEWAPDMASMIEIAPMLKHCDAYIATGSNNSARYFEQYFAKYPHIIRRNRTSVAILNGNETPAELEQLADDIHVYYGLGCRNITKMYVPKDYDFIPFIEACKKYNYFKDHNKYRNNYDYNLAIYILNNQFYMSTEGLLLVEHSSLFSPVAVLHYEFYSYENALKQLDELEQDIQAVAGQQYQAFGCLQTPSIRDFADGVNTIDFLNSLSLS
ncbi:MAG TPA: acyl-CoA reductase [Chitinophagaceae bacterium]|nr:acyl-CoA reductase [Chitinophagaceae bacterium]